MCAALTTKSLDNLSLLDTKEVTNDPFPNSTSSMASSIFLYGIKVDTGPKASILCTSSIKNGSLFLNKIGGKKGTFFQRGIYY